jgi:excisionase family DNA binding protein
MKNRVIEIVPFEQRWWCSVKEACLMTGLGRTTIYKAMGSGRLNYKREGRKRLVSVQSLIKQFGDNLERAAAGVSTQKDAVDIQHQRSPSLPRVKRFETLEAVRDENIGHVTCWLISSLSLRIY